MPKLFPHPEPPEAPDRPDPVEEHGDPAEPLPVEERSDPAEPVEPVEPTKPARRRTTKKAAVAPRAATPAEDPAPESAAKPPTAAQARQAAAVARKDAANRRTNPTSAPRLGFVHLDDQPERVNLLYYGKEGSGKTSCAAAMANLGPVLVVNAEGGLKAQPLRGLGVNTENVRVFPPAGEPLTFESLQAVYQQLDADLKADPNSWAGVILDSITEIYIGVLEETSALRVQSLRDQGRNPDEWFTDLADYGGMGKRLRHLLRRLRDLPCHVVITALERRDVDEDTSQVTYGPAVTPGVATDLLGYMDLVVYTKQGDEDGPYRGLTKNHGRIRAKDRFGVLPTVLPRPTFDRVVGYINGTLTAKTDPEGQLQVKLPKARNTKEDPTTP